MKHRLFTILLTSALVVTLYAQLDTNNNGMSDIWERHFNNGELFDASITAEGDEDGDGQSNAAESLAGTNPFEFSVPDGYFAAQVRHVPETWSQGPSDPEPILENPEAYEISWFGVAGKKYILQGSTDLKNWINITTEMGEGEEIIIACLPQDENDVPEPRFFWRVDVADVDSDGDGLMDYEELLYGTDPDDAYSNGWVDDFWLATRYEDPNDCDPFGDDDGDGLLNYDEYWYGTNPHDADTDGDGMPDAWETFYGFDPLNPSDALEDLDGDGLTNLQEYQLSSDPTTPNTFSRIPDLWVSQYYSSFSDFEPDADDDNDGLTNYQEFLHGTNPHEADSDGDGVSDGNEVTQGSNPLDSNSKTSIPEEERIEVPFTVGGDYASWKMEIKALGPKDERTFSVASSHPEPNTETFTLQKGNSYKIELKRVGGYEDWYCWEARINAQPNESSYNVAPGYYQLGSRNDNAKYFTVGDHWVVDNRDGLLTTHLHSQGTDVATGLVATLLPVQFKVYPDEEVGPYKPHKMNMDTRQKEKQAYEGCEKFVGHVYQSHNNSSKIDLIDYLDGADDPKKREVFEEALKWRSNDVSVGHELNWVIEPDPNKIMPYKIQVLSKGDDKTMDRLWITVVPRSTKTVYETWKTENQDKTWLSDLSPLYSSLEEKQKTTVIVPTVPLPTTTTVWRIPDPDRNCSPRIWETVKEHTDDGYFYHPGAYYEIRSEETANGHGHQACYDENRELIREGLSAGTADKSSPSNPVSVLSHLERDVKPYIWALQLDGNPVEGSLTYANLTKPIAYQGKHSNVYLDLRPPIANLKPELLPGTCPAP